MASITVFSHRLHHILRSLDSSWILAGYVLLL